jgi:mono/diheme cytochrome c family protein
MKNRPLKLALLGALVLPVAAFTYGGWAVITVDDLPEYVVAGKPVDLSFAVRQHGKDLLPGLSPKVTLKSGGTETSVNAKAAGERGHYVASVTAPRAGDWAVTIESGFRESRLTLLPVRAIAANAPAPRPLAESVRGHHLFIAKGCNTCHMRNEIGTEGGKIGPDLTGKRYVADYVAKFLADPESSPLSRTNTSSNARMPKLDLKEREIGALVAFLNSEERVSGRASMR